MKTGKLTDRLLVGAQPTAEDLDWLHDAGVAMVINLRTDGENGQALSPSAEGEAATSAGLAYRHIPVSLASLNSEQVEAVKAAIAEAEGPVYVHCGAGQRACAIGLLATGGGGSDAQSRAAELGFPMTDKALIRFVGAEGKSERDSDGEGGST